MQKLHIADEMEMQELTELKSLRLKSRLTQKEAAQKIGISLRSYVYYENEAMSSGTPKYRILLAEMDKNGLDCTVSIRREKNVITVPEP